MRQVAGIHSCCGRVAVRYVTGALLDHRHTAAARDGLVTDRVEICGLTRLPRGRDAAIEFIGAC